MFKELESIPLFKDVDISVLEMLEPLFEPYSCSAETAIFKQGEPALYLYILLDGAVDVLYKPYDGPTIILTSLNRGGIIGWSAVIGNPTYASGAICKADCQAIRMIGRDLHKLCATHPEAGLIILNLLADSVSSRWQDARDQIQTLLNSSVSAAQCKKSRKRKIKTRKENR